MPRFALEVNYDFYPVGQGLFSAGSLRSRHDTRAFPYIWVYDCGTNSKKSYLANALSMFDDDMRARSRHRTRIDLLTISHFDRDHISGMVALVSAHPVRDLLLPYMPLWQRLVIAATEDRGVTSQLTRFLVDPVAFITGLPGANVERILFVGGGDDDGDQGVVRPRLPEDGPERPQLEDAPEVPQQEDAPEGPDGRGRWRVAFEAGTPPNEEDEPRQPTRRRRRPQRDTRVEYVSPSSAIFVGGVWEFVPYNDATLSPLVTHTFRETVRWLSAEFLLSRTTVQRETWLRYIRLAYDSLFGNAGEHRNLVSLFLYAGPAALSVHCYMSSDMTLLRTRVPIAPPEHRKVRASVDAPSALYTGDGYINTPQRFAKLQTHLTGERMASLGVLQVMHHGSKNNWYSSVGEMFAPQFSVFSSEPGRKKSHPHGEVVKDFWLFRPVQVDETMGARFRFCLRVYR